MNITYDTDLSGKFIKVENHCYHYGSQAKFGPLNVFVQPTSVLRLAFTRRIFEKNLLIGNTNFEVQLRETSSCKKNSILLIYRPAFKKIIIHYYISNFVIKHSVEICLISCYISSNIIFSVSLLVSKA